MGEFPQMTLVLEAQWAAEEKAERDAREKERDAQEQEKHDLLATLNRVSVYETYCVDELIDPTRPW